MNLSPPLLQRLKLVEDNGVEGVHSSHRRVGDFTHQVGR